jgi:phytoene dehydrogenase-like protein
VAHHALPPRRDGAPVTTARTSYDAVVVGGGHNGLVAAAYLGRAGLRTVVLERRDVVGGACVTEEIAPGVRASTTSYIASMLRPEVIRDLDLARHGLRMIPCEPSLQVPFPDGDILPWWPDPARTATEIERLSSADARAFLDLDRRLKSLAAYLQAFFLEAPPDIHTRGLARLRELVRIGWRFRRMRGDELGALVSFMTTSMADLVQRRFESDKVHTLFLANSIYGRHGGPFEPGTAAGLLFHLLTGGEDEVQGFFGHVVGGMGSITAAMAEAARGFGVEIRTEAPVARIETRDGRARGVVLEDGTEIRARVVLSNADPKRTFLGLVDEKALPEEFVADVRAIPMNGPAAKVNMALAEEPKVTAMPADAGPGRRAMFTLVPSLEFAQRSAEAARRGDIPDELWVDCVVPSNVDRSLAPPGTHVMTCFVQFVPYRLRRGTWDERREELGDRVVRTIAEYAPNVSGAITARQVLTPLDLERTYGLTEGNISHGDLALDRLFFMRPVPGWSRYRTPIEGLYLCGVGTHPGGGVTGAPGSNAAHRVLRERRRWRR